MQGPSSSIRVVPVSAPFLGTFPWRVVTKLGNELIAVRPVQFRLVNDSAPDRARVLGSRHDDRRTRRGDRLGRDASDGR